MSLNSRKGNELGNYPQFWKLRFYAVSLRFGEGKGLAAIVGRMAGDFASIAFWGIFPTSGFAWDKFGLSTWPDDAPKDFCKKVLR